jgi:hypothetical protein
MWIGVAALPLSFAIFLLPANAAPSQSAGAAAQAANAQPRATEFSAQSRRTRRPPARIVVTPRYRADDVYPRYYPGRNAVRECTAHLVQEFRPSGTVITPRMDCFWRPG